MMSAPSARISSATSSDVRVVDSGHDNGIDLHSDRRRS